MNRNTFLIMAFLLSGIANALSAQELDLTANEKAGNTYQAAPDSMGLVMVSGQETGNTPFAAQPCVTTYSNQTVSSTVSVMGCTTLTTDNITVTSTGRLTLEAPTSVVINPSFVVQSGGTLLVGIKDLQLMIFKYDYDASGNRKSRSLTN